MLASIINLAVALVTLGLGAWSTLAGAVIALDAGFSVPPVTRHPVSRGVAMIYAGLILFVAGTIACARLLA